MSKVQVMDHPLIQHKVNYIRRKEVGSKEFREIVGEIAALMCYEATRDLKLQDVEIETLSDHVSVFEELSSFYQRNVRDQYENGVAPGMTRSEEHTSELQSH